ncbi:hypothetical protein E2562_016412 [Oryza meyeriana var. granulata]|uniref:Leucine-rich repeat-containing N-terminal plant-type domain-containing protein n=1 Tax=Oryza meyeriana var. granulata TaxID=110450 RepID=A0A6G1EX13_9ORYZ|nr:hypothetical protein E2562_016412 [Oryza meyeriana var. granulata]
MPWVVTNISLPNADIHGKLGELDFSALLFLAYIDLSNNSLHGHIPASIGCLSMLSYLDLTNNSFTGEIPSELGRFPSQLQARTREDDCDSLPQLVGRSGPPGGITNRRMVGGHAPLLLMGAVAGADARRCSGREAGATRRNRGGGGGRRWRAPPLLEEAGAAVGGGGRLPSVACRRRVGRRGKPATAGGGWGPPAAAIGVRRQWESCHRGRAFERDKSESVTRFD